MVQIAARIARYDERFTCEEIDRVDLAAAMRALDEVGMSDRPLSCEDLADAILTALTGMPSSQVLLRLAVTS